jgi:hypothetical protein
MTVGDMPLILLVPSFCTESLSTQYWSFIADTSGRQQAASGVQASLRSKAHAASSRRTQDAGRRTVMMMMNATTKENLKRYVTIEQRVVR